MEFLAVIYGYLRDLQLSPLVSTGLFFHLLGFCRNRLGDYLSENSLVDVYFCGNLQMVSLEFYGGSISSILQVLLGNA